MCSANPFSYPSLKQVLFMKTYPRDTFTSSCCTHVQCMAYLSQCTHVWSTPVESVCTCTCTCSMLWTVVYTYIYMYMDIHVDFQSIKPQATSSVDSSESNNPPYFCVWVVYPMFPLHETFFLHVPLLCALFLWGSLGRQWALHIITFRRSREMDLNRHWVLTCRDRINSVLCP